MKKEELLKLICTYPPERLISFISAAEKAITIANSNNLLVSLHKSIRIIKLQSMTTIRKTTNEPFNNQQKIKFIYKQKKKTIS